MLELTQIGTWIKSADLWVKWAGTLDEKKWLTRIIFLETVAGVPGMVIRQYNCWVIDAIFILFLIQIPIQIGSNVNTLTQFLVYFQYQTLPVQRSGTETIPSLGWVTHFWMWVDLNWFATCEYCTSTRGASDSESLCWS